MKSKYFPILVICFVWLLFSLPFLLKQQVPFPSRYLVSFFSPWSAYPQFYSPVKNAAMPDIIGQIYPWKVFTIDTLKSGAIPFWDPYNFSGTPHLANYQSAVLSPLNLGFFIMPFVDWWSMLVLLQPLLAGLFTYLLARSLKQSSAAAIISSISFMFCGFLTCWMGYATLGYAILFLPLALFAIEKYHEQKKSRYLLLLGLAIPLSFFSGHFQISLYFLLFTFAYALFKLFQTKDLRATCYTLLAVFSGLLICAPQLLPTIELYGQSLRSTIFQKTEAIPWGYLPTFLAPDFYGNPVTRNTWFGSYAEWNAYVGVASIFLALYALLKIKCSRILFFAGAGIVSFFLAFNSPLLDLLVFLKVPVLSTSAAGRIIVLFSFCAAILAGFGLDIFIKNITEKRFKSIYLFLGVFSLFYVVLWIVSIFHFLSPDHGLIARSNLRLPSILFGSLVLISILGRFLKTKKTGIIICVLFILLISFDMLRFSNKWMPFDPKNLVYPQTAVTEFFPRISGQNRVFGNFGGEGSVYYKLPSTEGYDAVYIRRYGQFIASLDDGRLHDAFRSTVELPLAGKYILQGANLLGIRYMVHRISDGQNVWEFPFWKYDPKTIKLLFDDKKYQVLENTNAYPRAFLVGEVEVEKDPQKILDKMFKKDKPLSRFAVIEQSLQSTDELGSGNAKILSHKPNVVRIQTDSGKLSFLVLTDSYYPGWEATVDGRVSQIYRTDFTFRGVLVPAGKHIVEFKYEPESFRYGVYLAIIGVVGILGLCIFERGKQLK